jgi:hypothetical protein
LVESNQPKHTEILAGGNMLTRHLRSLNQGELEAISGFTSSNIVVSPE